jgi:hypothetical protein
MILCDTSKPRVGWDRLVFGVHEAAGRRARFPAQIDLPHASWPKIPREMPETSEGGVANGYVPSEAVL